MSMTLGLESSIRSGCAGCRQGGPGLDFSMAFQPIVDMHERRIDSYEALVRGMAGQGAASVLSQVTPDNLYQFDQSCRVRAIELGARLGMARTLSINFLPNAVYEPRACIQTTLSTARRTGFPLDRLTFEILESESIADEAHLKAIIAEYRRYGFRIALDDFATGYSGLARLAALHPDIVKIDRVLVQDCDQDPTRLRILAGLVRLCADIDVKIVFEGAERRDEVMALADIGARFIQGFYFARPAFEQLTTDNDIAWG